MPACPRWTLRRIEEEEEVVYRRSRDARLMIIWHFTIYVSNKYNLTVQIWKIAYLRSAYNKYRVCRGLPVIRPYGAKTHDEHVIKGCELTTVSREWLRGFC